MTGLTADGQGRINGSFMVPSGVVAGTKEVVFEGAGGSRATATFTGQGQIERELWQRQRNVVAIRVDPLAQTFTLGESSHVTGADLWFADKPTTQATVQIRETSVGFPTGTILAEAVLEPSEILIGGASTRAVFRQPIPLQAGIEYALVVLCNDAVGSLSTARLGDFDTVAQSWITSQPYTVGVLLSSSNASTWTAHQDRDMAFRILRADYTQNERIIDLGVAAVTNATDLLLMSYADRPASSTVVEYTLTLPDSSEVVVTDGQPVQLAAPVTGNIGVKAKLIGGGRFSPVLWPDTQLIYGTVANTADYVTRAVPGSLGCTVKAIFEANVPSGANVQAYYKGIDPGDTWAALPVDSTRNVDDGFVEFICEATNVQELAVQVRLVLTGSPAARPRVRDLRVIVTEGNP